MNEHFRPLAGEGPIQLARQSDFDLASLRVRPSACEVVAAGRALRLEPRVMQVLVALAQAEGEVLSRDDLIVRCWDGRVVGEDAINRCIARLRRAFEAAGGEVSINTIARVGYRLEALRAPTAVAAPAHRRVPPPVWALLAAAAVLVAAGGLYVLRAPGQWMLTDYRPVAAEVLIERHPAFSPDGRSLAYSAGQDVVSRRIVVRDLHGGPAVRVTGGPGDDYAPAWAPSSDRIAFARFLPGRPCTIVIKQLPAGAESQVGHCLHDPRTRLAWSHGGQELVFTDRSPAEASTHLRALNLATGAVRDLTPAPPDGQSDVEPVVSPDGRRLAFLRDRSWGSGELRVLDLGSGRVSPVALPGVEPGGVAWTPDSRALVVSSDHGDYSLWLVRPEGGEPRRLLAAMRAIGRVAASRTGEVALEVDSNRTNLVRLGDGDGAGELAAANSFDWSPDFDARGDLAFVSDRGGGPAVWMLRPGQGPIQVTHVDFAHLHAVRWSPDGRRIAFTGGRDGAAGAFVVNSDGTGLTRLRVAGLDFGAPAWTPGGLIAPVRDARGWRLVRIALDGAARPQAVSDYGWVSVRSAPQGLFGVRADAPGVWRLDPGGRPVQVAGEVTAGSAEDWAIAGDNVYTLNRTGHGEGDIYSRSLGGGPRRLLGHASRIADEPGLALDPITGAPVYPKVLIEDSDLGLMTLKKSS